MRTAASYSLIIGGTLTTSGASLLTGDLGINPAAAITDGGVLTVQGSTHNGDATAAQAYADMQSAYADALGRTSVPNTFPATGGGTYFAGVYNQGGESAPAGTMTLDGQDDPNSVFIFQINGAFAPSGEMLLVNGAQSGNVFWQVNGAVAPGANSVTVGTILAIGAASLGASSTVTGRVLVTAAGTLSTNTITTTNAYTSPSAPTDVVASAGNGQASVAFSAPADTGGSEILNYTAASSDGGHSATAASSPITITGLTNGTTYSFTVKATNAAGSSVNSIASAAITPVSPAPTPAPTPTPTPTPTPAPAPAPAPPVAPTAPSASTPGAPTSSTGLAPAPADGNPIWFVAEPPPSGTASVLLDGEPVQTVFTADPRNGTVMLSGDGWWVVFGSQSLVKGANALDSAGTPNFRAGGVLEASCYGFTPYADINFYFMNQNMAFSLGEITVTKAGTCSGSLPVPAAMAKGVYTLQIDSMVTDTRQVIHVMGRLSASIRANILAPTVKKTPVQKATAQKANVQFNAYSSSLTNPAKRTLNKLVKQLPSKSSNLVRIVGFVGPGGTLSHVTKLSNARAKSVARYLKSQGVRGKYVISGGGNRVSSAKAGQSARVTVFPNRARPFLA